MKYKVLFTDKSKKQLMKMDRSVAKLITSWIVKNLQDCEDPRRHGKALTADRSGQWRYRVGDYRLLAEIQDENIIILIVEIGHRRDIYKN